MKAYIYNCIKKHSSTMKPVALDGEYPAGQKFWTKYAYTAEVLLKDNCSISDPVFKLSGASFTGGGKIFSCNYIYVPDMGRGYWVHNWQFEGGIWTADCHVDVLGSFNLPTQPQFVLRSSEEFDNTIKDDFYPTTSSISSYSNVWSWPFASNIGDGRFILGVVNDSAGSYGSISYYVMDSNALYTIVHQLLSDISYMGISADEVSVELQKGLINPMQYIKSCMWVPYVPATGNAVTSVKCGWWTFDVTAYPLASPQKQIAFTTREFDWHAQIDRGLWLMQAPTYSLTLNAMPWGLIDIPMDKFSFANTYSAGAKPKIGYSVVADAISGMATLQVSALSTNDGVTYNGNIVASVTTQLGIPIALAQSSQDVYGGIMSIANGAIQGAQSALSAPSTPLDTLTFGATRVVKTAAATAMGAGVGLANAIPGLMPTISTVSNSGSYLNIGWSWSLMYSYVYISEENNKLNGRPLCKNRILPEMGGFVRVLNPECHADDNTIFPPTDVEVEEMNYYLSQGIYIEGWLDG